MAGWLKKDNGCSVEESSEKIQEIEVCFDFGTENYGYNKVKTLFDDFLEGFLKQVFSHSCFRQLPPVIGEGQQVDLFELHIVVRKRGGYNSVSKNGLWSLVATDCGFDSIFGAALKLVYVKYLDTLDRWLRKIVNDKQVENTEFEETHLSFSGPLMELESDLEVFLSGIADKVKKEEFVEFKKSSLESGNEDLDFVDLKVDVKSVHEKCSNENRGGNVRVNEKQSVDNGDEQTMDKDFASRKRKRECCMGMLNWIRKVAKTLAILILRHYLKGISGSVMGLRCNKWFQSGISGLHVVVVLLSCECVGFPLFERLRQKKQKMHPSMYDDDQCGSERLRCSQRLLFAKDSSRKERHQHLSSESSSSDFQSDDDKQCDSTADSVHFRRRQKRIPIGPLFQADLPDFCGADYESDSKCLGTKFWPLDKNEQNKSLIERDPIGKGRRESCGCQFPGSLECVKFHVREKRVKLKLELGSAYYKWKFDGMGEIVALSWTKEDEDKFQDIVESNRLSRRGCQNRSGTSNIDSDDEESEFGPIVVYWGDFYGDAWEHTITVTRSFWEWWRRCLEVVLAGMDYGVDLREGEANFMSFGFLSFFVVVFTCPH
ncbi:hypothetical protein DH2020_002139 [Rehmannia glutinosa]|uniref:ARID domain-containing protein n=1 Tax=Rehmannia glutinosa TaxID=99300 RepID=A0ABR0XT99_REHGL